MRRMMLVGLAMLLVATTIGCAAGPTEERPKVSGSSVTSTTRSGDSSVSLTAEPRSVETGGGVSLTLVVRNLSAEPRTFELSSSQAYDFVAYEKGGEEVWRWSAGMMFTQVIGSETIDAKGSNVYKIVWSTTGLMPGTYTVEGYFLGLKDVRPSVALELTAPK